MESKNNSSVKTGLLLIPARPADLPAVDLQIGDAGARRTPRSQRRRVGQGGFELVGLKAP